MLISAGLSLHPKAATADTTIASAVPSAGSPYTGVWTGGPSTADGSAFDDLGVGWARATVMWESVEPTNGTFVWTGLDQAMAAAGGANGHRSVLALVRNNPAWAAVSRCTLTTDTEQQRLASFVGTLAARYPGVIWQLYNEEDNTSPANDAQSNLGGCFGTRIPGGSATPDGRGNYARTLEAVSTAMRRADPTSQLAAGGVASNAFTDQSPAFNFDRGFLPGVMAQLKADGRLSALDYATVHYYSSQSPLYIADGIDLVGRVNRLRLDIEAAGLAASELKPLLADELSYTDLDGLANQSAFTIGQRAYVPKLLARAAAVDLRGAFWFWLQDTQSGLGSDNTYGLRDLNGAQKPSYRAMRYFNSVVTREDQFVRTLDLAAVSPKLEGYEFTAAGRSLQIVWNQTDATSIAYTPPGTITSVTDTEGAPVAQSGSTVTIGSEPRFIFYTPVPGQLLSQPVRVVDTRAPSGLPGAGQPMRGYTTPNCYVLAGTAGIPANAVGLILNLTTTAHAGDGWVTVYPAGGAIPSTSNVNFASFEYAIANNATVRLGTGGALCATGMPGTHLLIDVVGYLADVGPSGPLQLLPQPTRVVDTRSTSPFLGAGHPLLGYNTPNCYTLAGVGGVPTDAVGLIVNVTATGYAADGWVTVFPGAGPIPSTSNLNFIPAKYATSNAGAVSVSPGGQVCATGQPGTHLILDVVGYLSHTSVSGPIRLLAQPTRVVDTRATSPFLGAGHPLLGYNIPNCYTLAGVGGVPANATGLLVNITTTGYPADGWVTIFPGGVPIPSTSNVNFSPIEYAIANGATVKIGTGGQVCATGLPTTHLLLDAVGYLLP